MPACDPMTIDERRKYIKRMAERYWVANRTGRSQILTEMEVMTSLHRKSLTRLLNGPTLERQPRTSQRSRIYSSATEDAIRVVWESLDYVCAERLTPALQVTAKHLAGFGELRMTAEIQTQLADISRSTVQRFLSRIGQDLPRLPRRGPEAANRVARDIPMGRLPWQTAEPGHFEVDLVHHCGISASGDYVHTLQMIDIATGWSERVAILGRGERAMRKGFGHILERLPFPIVQLHPDNGSEFLNNHLIRFWGESIVGLKLSRSRPYHKNDNRFVEQKNDTLVRAYLGHARLDTAVQCEKVNQLYDQMWVYYNLFQPVLHLVAKEVEGDRIKRQWDEAQSPYQRLVSTGLLAKAAQSRLALMYEQTNPRQLRRTIYKAIGGLWDKRQAVFEVDLESEEVAS